MASAGSALEFRATHGGYWALFPNPEEEKGCSYQNEDKLQVESCFTVVLVEEGGILWGVELKTSRFLSIQWNPNQTWLISWTADLQSQLGWSVINHGVKRLWKTEIFKLPFEKLFPGAYPWYFDTCIVFLIIHFISHLWYSAQFCSLSPPSPR